VSFVGHDARLVPPLNLSTFAMGVALVPFLVLAFQDNVLHFRARSVPRLENVLHVLLAFVLFFVIGSAFMGRMGRMLAGLAVFSVVGALDEFGYHRASAIPVEEHDVHAKQHFALFVFVCVAFGASWYREHGLVFE
jgi:hypothetical protein